MSASYGRFYFAVPTDLNVRAYGAQTTAQVFNYDPAFDAIFADPTAPYATKRNAKAWAKVQIQLQQLKSASVAQGAADSSRTAVAATP